MDETTRQIVDELAKQRASLARCLTRLNTIQVLFRNARNAHRAALMEYLASHPDESHASIARKFQVVEGTVRYHSRKHEQNAKGTDVESSDRE